MSLFDLFTLLLVTAAAIATVNHLSVRLPQPIALLIGSLTICLLLLAADPLTGRSVRPWLARGFERVDMPGLFLNGVLGFLLFSASLNVTLAAIRENRWTVILLSVGSVVLSTWIFCGTLYGFCRLVGVRLPIGWCAVIGAVLAPTDAVVVDGLLRRVRMPEALRAAIAGESLLNDGAGVVLFVVALKIAGGQHGVVGHGRIAEAMLIAGGGGMLLGGSAGWLTGRLMRVIDDAALNLMLSVALVLFAYRAAHLLGVSGPVAVAVAGLMLGLEDRPDRTRNIATEDWRATTRTFWSLLDETLTAVLFLLIGLQVARIPFGQIAWAPVLASVPLALAARLVSTGLPVLFLRGSWREKGRTTAVLTWAGMRGGVSIAMVLAAPASRYRDEVLAIAYAVVLSSTLGQGLTMRPLLRRLFSDA